MPFPALPSRWMGCSRAFVFYIDETVRKKINPDKPDYSQMAQKNRKERKGKFEREKNRHEDITEKQLREKRCFRVICNFFFSFFQNR